MLTRRGPLSCTLCVGSRQGHRNLLEEVLDVMPSLRRRLHVQDPKFLCSCLQGLCCHLPINAKTEVRLPSSRSSRRFDVPLIIEIRLVAHQYDDDVLSPLVPHILDPLVGVLERYPAC